MSASNHPNVNDVQWTENNLWAPNFHSTLISAVQAKPIERTNSIDSGYVGTNSCDVEKEKSTKKKRKSRKCAVKKYQCDICKQFLSSRQALETHILAKFGQRPFKCDYELCEYSSTTKQNLESHRKRIHINPIGRCKLCDGKTRDIEKHMRKKHSEIPDSLSLDHQMVDNNFDNSIENSFSAQTMFNVHEIKHSRVLSVLCEICDLECDSDATKNEHKKKMHTFS